MTSDDKYMTLRWHWIFSQQNYWTERKTNPRNHWSIKHCKSSLSIRSWNEIDFEHVEIGNYKKCYHHSDWYKTSQWECLYNDGLSRWIIEWDSSNAQTTSPSWFGKWIFFPVPVEKFSKKIFGKFLTGALKIFWY